MVAFIESLPAPDNVDLVLAYLRKRKLPADVLGFMRGQQDSIIFSTTMGEFLVEVGEVSHFVYFRFPGGKKMGFVKKRLVEMYAQLQ